MHTSFARHLAVAFGAASLVGLSACASDRTAGTPVETVPPPVTVGPGPTADAALPDDDAVARRAKLLGLAAEADVGV